MEDVEIPNETASSAAARLDPTLRHIVATLGGDIAISPPDDLSRGGSARIAPTGGGVEGWYQCTTIRPGFSIVTTDASYDAETDCEIVGGDSLKFHFKLSGTSIIGGCGAGEISVGPGSFSFLVQPTDSTKIERLPARTRERSVTLICAHGFIRDLLGPYARQLPSELSDYLASPPSGLSLHSVPLSSAMRGAAEDLIAPRQSQALQSMMTEARSLELLHLAINRLIESDAAAVLVRSRDRKRIRELCDLLSTDTAATLSLGQLCKLLAWNETQLTQCFKRVTGQTISEYRQQLRMERALRALRQTELSVTEIALDAGYEHPANFATAFKRTYGYSPRDARLRG